MVSKRKIAAAVVVFFVLIAVVFAVRGRTGDKSKTALINSSAEYLDWIKKENADIGRKDGQGRSLIHFAAYEGDIKLLEQCVAFGTNVNEKSNTGSTTAHYAVSVDQITALKWLKEHGADFLQADEQLLTPLDLSVLRNQRLSREWLIQNGGLPVLGGDREKWVYEIVQNYREQVKKIKTKDPKEFAEELHRISTPMHYAAGKGDLDIMRTLYAAFEPIDEARGIGIGSTPIFGAIGSGNLNKVKWLLAVGASPASRYIFEDGDTVLHYAAQKGQLEILQFLNGLHIPGINLTTKVATMGEQPMHKAARNGHIHVLEWLALPEQKVKIDAVSDSNANILFDGASGGHLDVVKWAHSKGVPINQKVKSGRSALFAAAEEHPESGIVEWLIEKGADIREQDSEKNTLVHVAAKKGSMKLMKFLKERGLSVDSKNGYRQTPLYIAATGNSGKGYPEIVAWLLDTGIELREYEKKDLLSKVKSEEIKEMITMLSHQVSPMPSW